MFNKLFARLMPMMEGDGGAGGGGTGGSSGGDRGTGAGGQGGTGGSGNIEIDYDKLASIVAGKQSATEESVLKGYFKQQGLSPDEAKQAIAKFKEEKAKNTPDVGALQQQAANAQQAALTAQIEKEAFLLSGELGVDLKTMPYLIKMADMKDVAPEGSIDKEKLKEALEQVLKDIPQLKGQAQEGQEGGFRFGAGGKEGGSDNTDEQLDRIFGIKKK